MTLATFYRHFPSKQDLILAYLQRVHDDFATRAAAAQAAAKDPGDALELIGTTSPRSSSNPASAAVRSSTPPRSSRTRTARSCAPSSLTAPGSMHLVRDTFASAGHPRPDLAASRYVMLRDGATTAGHLGDPSQARDAFDRSVAGPAALHRRPAETDDPVGRSHVLRGRLDVDQDPGPVAIAEPPTTTQPQTRPCRRQRGFPIRQGRPELGAGNGSLCGRFRSSGLTVIQGRGDRVTPNRSASSTMLRSPRAGLLRVGRRTHPRCPFPDSATELKPLSI